MMRELQVAHGLVLQRLDALEQMAHGVSGAAECVAAHSEDEVAGKSSTGVLAVAGSVQKLQVRWMNSTWLVLGL